REDDRGRVSAASSAPLGDGTSVGEQPIARVTRRARDVSVRREAGVLEDGGAELRRGGIVGMSVRGVLAKRRQRRERGDPAPLGGREASVDERALLLFLRPLAILVVARSGDDRDD